MRPPRYRRIQKKPAPYFDADKREYRICRVDLATLVSFYKFDNSAATEKAAPLNGRGREDVLNQRTQFVTNPVPQRRAESRFWPVDDFSWQIRLHGPFENPFANAAVLFEVIRKLRRERDQVPIEQWNPDLDAMSHRSLVGVIQVVVR